MVYNVDLVDVH